MDFRHIDAFRALMLARTTTRAAQLIGLSQPAISRLIAELERSTGLKLFTRERSRLEPTAQALSLFDEVQRRYAGLENIREFAVGLLDTGRTTLRVGSSMSFGLRFFAEATARFRERHPTVQIDLTIGSSTLVRDQTVANTLSLGIVNDSVDVRPVDARLFAELDALCVLPAGHPLAAREVVTVDEFRRYPLISYRRAEMLRWGMTPVFAGLGLSQIAAVVQYSVNVAELVRAGVGIGLMHPVSAYDFLGSGLVFRRFEPGQSFRSWKIRPVGPGGAASVDALSEVLDETLVKVLDIVAAHTAQPV
jgi:DNA-binding transcriptional LysR family regulator